MTQSIPTKRVFLTGATTMIGRETTRHLTAIGHKVIGTGATLADAGSIRADGGIPAYPDLTRAGETRSAMLTLGSENLIVVNLAAQIANGAPFLAADWSLASTLLVEGTAALIEAAKAAGVQYFLHGSFAAADVHSEDEALAPVLSAIKRAETLVIESGLPYAIMRFGYAYADAPELKNVTSALRAGRPVYSSEKRASAGWIHAADAAAAIGLALESQPVGARMIVVDDLTASPADFLGYFSSSQGLGAPSHSALSASLARMALGAAQYGFLNASAHPSNVDTKTLLGWQPRFPTYKQGLDDILLTWRAAMQVKG